MVMLSKAAHVFIPVFGVKADIHTPYRKGVWSRRWYSYKQNHVVASGH